ncbi:Tetratricopeptide repeat protein 39B-like protein [Dinothrombium tinctorium]|uniref:Tetratricopeptide repeat protein 39B-like protein n=1 Tax=Dinothrombium tinctorium TaxID=1965070 RepID=A0A3S3NYQ1_9ACAR|nr:Tetratricopeptide repeat protein 39B-like protein [Dinothrombium tinctorium]
MYHHFGCCVLYYAESVLTLNKEVMKAALQEMEECLAAYNRKYRKQCGLFSRTNYELYSDEEVHAELSYHVILAASALLGSIYDTSFAGFVKGVYRMTTGYIGLRDALYILNTRKNWSHPRMRDHFEALLKLCLGIFEIVIAYMPAKLSRLLDFIGFSGQLEVGINYLEESFEIKNTFGSIVSGLVLMLFYNVAEYFYGLGDAKLEMLKEVECDCLRICPDSPFTALVKASNHFHEARFEKAISVCDEYLAQSDAHPIYIRHMFHGLKSLIKACLCQWKEAAYEMQHLLESKWAPAVAYYLYGSFLFMETNNNQVEQCDDNLRIIFEKIPMLRKRIGGRKVFHDNFVVNRSQKYFHESRKFFLPAYELWYIWNFLKIMVKRKESVEMILDDIKSRLAVGEHAFTYYDDYANLLFLKAVVLKFARQQTEAKKLFIEILKQSEKVKNDKFILAHCTFEIGLIHANNGEYSEARSWIMRSKKNYSDYLTECLLHFRADLALNHILSLEQKDKFKE